MADSGEGRLAGRVAFTYPAFVLYEVARIFTVVSMEMISVAVGWQIYAITHSKFDLGYVGLAQFLPGILLFLVSGHAADRFNRKQLLMLCYAAFGVCAALFLLVSLRPTHSIRPIYAVLVLLGVVRSLNGPVSRALLPQLVAEEHFQNAVAWHSTIFQVGTILGPSLGGLIYALFRGPTAVYATALGCYITAVACTVGIRFQPKARDREPINLKTLPAYAQDILHTGPWGLGLLRSAPAVGAGTMAILLAYRPLRRRVGTTMLWCVAAFGIFTIVFGISRSLTVSLVALALTGAADMVSVVIRVTLVQVATPDQMRGRVNAVDMIFIGASNELGQFESGVTAGWLGTAPAVILGGIGTLVVTALWAWWFPALRRADSFPATPDSDPAS